MGSTTYKRRSVPIQAVMLDSEGAKRPAVIDQLDTKGLRLRADGYRPAIGDRLDLEFCRHEDTGLGIVLMRVIVVRADTTGIEARLMFKSETLYVASGPRDVMPPAARVRNAARRAPRTARTPEARV